MDLESFVSDFNEEEELYSDRMDYDDDYDFPCAAQSKTKYKKMTKEEEQEFLDYVYEHGDFNPDDYLDD